MNYLFGIQGRIGRLQWWGGQCIILMLFVAPLLMLGIGIGDMSEERVQQIIANNAVALIAAILAIYALAVWMNVATTVKRYHDRNKSGFWFLVIFIPFIGGIWQLVECGFLSGTPGANNFGQRGGGSAFGDYADDGSSSSTSAMLRRTQEEPARRRQTAVAPAVASHAPRAATKPAGFGRRGLS
jgi:uncharacterized membrane protein YhaH (DUF805 family)